MFKFSAKNLHIVDINKRYANTIERGEQKKLPNMTDISARRHSYV